jgi:hypothetical protein
MKKAYPMIALAVLVCSMAVAANAQNSGLKLLIANVPFQFNVGDTTLPAGEYTIYQTNPASDCAVMQIRAKDGSRSLLVQMNSIAGKTADASTLVFHRYGNKYFLAQAWIDGDSEGLNVPGSRAERATKKEMAALGVKREAVALSSR